VWVHWLVQALSVLSVHVTLTVTGMSATYLLCRPSSSPRHLSGGYSTGSWYTYPVEHMFA
jgi:hypothetical protein